MASYAAIFVPLAILFTAEASAMPKPHRPSIRGMRGDGNDSGLPMNINESLNDVNLHNRDVRKLSGIASSEVVAFRNGGEPMRKDGKREGSVFLGLNKNNKSKDDTHDDTDSPTGAPTLSPTVSLSTQAPFVTDLIENSNQNSAAEASEQNSDSSIVNGATNEDICLAVTAQEPSSESPIREISMTVDVVYQQSNTVSPTDIQSYLDDQNLAMALWIAGCQDEANMAIEAAEGKRRALQEETAVPLITYSQVGSWEATGPCVETGASESSSAPLCQQGFASVVQVQSRESASLDELRNQISLGFGATSKPALLGEEGVSAVDIREISQDTTEEPLQESEANQAVAKKNRFTRRTIALCSVGGACVFVSIVLFVLIGVYEKRRKTYGITGGHVPFEDEFEKGGKGISDIQSEDSGNRIWNANSFDTSESGQGHDRTVLFGGNSRTASPCYNAPDAPMPYDERRECSAATCQVCEGMRQEGIGRSRSSAPVMRVPIDVALNTMATPDLERRRMALDADASRRNYSHEDAMEL